MYLLVGLGNPGKKYGKTRHNIGFNVLDDLADKFQIKINKKKFNGLYVDEKLFGKEICILEPQSFMNLSGEVVRGYINYFKVLSEDVLVVHDDVDLSFGQTKFGYDSGHAGHNGVRSIIDCLGTKAFFRLRIGVGRPLNENIETSDYVLSKFDKKERDELDQLIDRCVQAIEAFYLKGFKRARELFNN